MRPTVTLCLAAALLASSAGARAMTTDPNLWLEGVEDAKALDWVKAQNADSLKALAQAPGFIALRDDLRAILDSDARIPVIEKLGEQYYYNFWKDAEHPAGLWRRTTLAEYRKPKPAWETVIDLDAINAAEKANWVWHGAECLRPEYKHCLVSLSRGGSDADVTREFDLSTKAWVKDGFFRPEAKGSLSWRDRDSVYVATDFGAGSMTDSGYARIVKLWQRGTPMASATLVYEGKQADLAVAAYRDHTKGFERDFVWRGLAFYNNEMFLRGPDGTLRKIEAPNSADKGIHREYLTLQLREPLTENGKTYAAGSLLVTNLKDFMAGKREYTVLFEPSATVSLAGATWTRNYLMLNVLDDVKSRIQVQRPNADGSWTQTEIIGQSEIGDLTAVAVDDEQSDAYFLTSTSFLSPTSLTIAEVGKGDSSEKLKQLPAFFDASGFEVSQHFVKSKDGTRVPYFMVSAKGLVLNGNNPTLLYGYGGFEISETPFYSAGVGRAWLSQGGVYVVGNIRGGGEYGPAWHSAALRESARAPTRISPRSRKT